MKYYLLTIVLVLVAGCGYKHQLIATSRCGELIYVDREDGRLASYVDTKFDVQSVDETRTIYTLFDGSCSFTTVAGVLQ